MKEEDETLKRLTLKKKSMCFGAILKNTVAGQPLGKIFAIAMVLGLLSSGLVIMLVPEEVCGDGEETKNWWNNDWRNRIQVIVNNTKNGNDLEDYQIEVNLSYESEMKQNFDDVRFIDAFGNELAYWFAEVSDGKYVIVWVKLNFIPKNEETYLYVYYNNNDKEIVSQSNGTATFEIFDDFNGNDDSKPDSKQWDIVDSEDVRIVDNHLEFYNSDGDSGIRSKKTFSLTEEIGIAIMVDWRQAGTHSGDTYSYYAGLWIDPAERIVVQHQSWGGLGWSWHYKGWKNGWNGWSQDTDWHQTEIKFTNSTQNFTFDDPTQYVLESIELSNESRNFEIIADARTGNNEYYDNLRIRKYSLEEPSITLGTEEEFIFSIHMKKTSYYPGNLLNVTVTHTGGPSNVTFIAREPNDDVHLIETISLEDWYYPQDELVAHWSFDEGFGQTAKDGTGNGHDGTLGIGLGEDNSDPTWVNGLSSGMALKFDGDDDYIEVPHSDDLNLTDFTIFTWIYSEEWDSTHGERFLVKGESYELNTQVGGYASVTMWNGGSWPSADSITPLELNNWHFLVGTYDQEEFKIYVDGELEAVESHEDTTDTSNDVIRIGCNFGKAVFFNGTLDEMGIFNIALTQEEILDFYHQRILKYPSVTLQFRLPDDALAGNWTVHATNDVDSSNANITFEVLGLPPESTLTLTLVAPAEIKQNEVLQADFIISNGFDYQVKVLIVLQLKDPSLHALKTAYRTRVVNATEDKSWKLSVKIPKDAELGEYFLQGQMLTGMPDEGGYVLDYTTTSVIVIED